MFFKYLEILQGFKLLQLLHISFPVTPYVWIILAVPHSPAISLVIVITTVILSVVFVVIVLTVALHYFVRCRFSYRHFALRYLMFGPL